MNDAQIIERAASYVLHLLKERASDAQEIVELTERVNTLSVLLNRNLEQMKKINGPEDKCVYGHNSGACENHRLIYETEEALKQAEGK